MGLIESVLKTMRLKRSGLTGDQVDDIDLLASEYPQLGLGEGYYMWTTGASISFASMSMTVPSGKLFHMKDLTIALGDAAPSAPIVFFDGPGVSAPKYIWMISAASAANHIQNIVGAVFQSHPMFSTSLSQVSVKIGGLIRERLSEA